MAATNDLNDVGISVPEDIDDILNTVGVAGLPHAFSGRIDDDNEPVPGNIGQLGY